MAEVMNAIPFPGRFEEPEQGEGNILYSTVGLVKIGGTFKMDAQAGPNGDGVIPMGTVVAVDPDTKKYVEYQAGMTAVGILLDNIDVSDSDQLANFAIRGVFYADKVRGLDADALEQLGAVETTLANGTKIIKM